MPSWGQPTSRHSDKNKFQRAASHHNSARQKQKHNLGSAHSSGLPIFDHSSGLERNAPFPSHSLDCVEDYAATSRWGAEEKICHRELFSKVKELDARCSTFNNAGRDQNNHRYYYITFMCHNHPCSRDTSDVDDPGINRYVGLDDCQATAIESATTFVTTNVAVAAPYLGISDCNSENLTVKIPSVRYTFFSD